MNTSTKIIPVILSGGAGSRLWPLSRELYPKQLLPLVGEYTLLQQTIQRLGDVVVKDEPVIVCNEEHRFLVAEQIREIGITNAEIILEPVGRNTAPALTLSALAVINKYPDALLLVMPADHIIQMPDEFHDAILEGIPLAENNKLVTFGIQPDKPETGYGYIRAGENHIVEEFVEKPDLDTATAYLNSGRYFWNSGIFLLKAQVWIDELRLQNQVMLETCRHAFSKGEQDQDFFRIDRRIFETAPSDSIDYAVMEHTGNAAMVPMHAGWSDIGAFSSLWEISTQDELGNVIQGDVIHDSTQNSLLVSQHRLLATVGLTNHIVIETADAVLVADKNSAQDVKKIVALLKQNDRIERNLHRKVFRPWGSYECIDSGLHFQVKRLTINSGESISLQLHHHRAEHWIVVTGTAKVTCEEKEFLLSENESTYIPIGSKHRLENPGHIPLEIIEVQSGSYLGEDDIVRFEDKYNR